MPQAPTRQAGLWPRPTSRRTDYRASRPNTSYTPPIPQVGRLLLVDAGNRARPRTADHNSRPRTTLGPEPQYVALRPLAAASISTPPDSAHESWSRISSAVVIPEDMSRSTRARIGDWISVQRPSGWKEVNFDEVGAPHALGDFRCPAHSHVRHRAARVAGVTSGSPRADAHRHRASPRLSHAGFTGATGGRSTLRAAGHLRGRARNPRCARGAREPARSGSTLRAICCDRSSSTM